MNTIKLTRENLHELSASPGRAGFTRKQIELLGFTWPPQKGWLTSLIGKEIDVALYEQVKGSGHKKWRNPITMNTENDTPVRRIALEIVDKLESDLMDRKDLGPEWELIGVKAREEIRQSWVKMVAEVLSRRLPTPPPEPK